MRLLAGFAATILAVAAVAVPAVAALLLMPGLWLPSLIERRLESRLDRAVEIAGPVDLRLFSTPPALEIDGLRIANPAWTDEAWFLRARQVRVEIPWARLADLSLQPSLVALASPRVYLLRTRSGGVTWPRLDSGANGGGGGLPVDRLRVSDGVVIYRVPDRRTDLTARVETHQDHLAVEAQGIWRGENLTASLTGGQPSGLVRDRAAYPLRGSLISGALHLEVDGTLADPLALSGVDVALAGRGPTLAEVGALIGVAFPASPPFDLAGRLRDTGTGWVYGDAQGTIGDSAVAGRVEVAFADVPRVTVEVSSSHLRVRDALVIAGLGDVGGEGGSASGGPLIPDAPMPTDALSGFGLTLTLRAEGAVGGPVMLGRLAVNATIDDDRLRIDPIQATLADGGSVDGRVVVDASQGVPRVAVEGAFERVRFSVPVAGATAQGAFGGNVDLTGRGETLHAVLGSANGKAAVMVSGGHLSADILGRAGIGFGDLVGLVLPEEEDGGAVLHCAAATAEVTDGIARIPGLVVDTETGRMEGKGTLDLGAQTLDLALRIDPAGPQLLSVSGPVEVAGPWRSPTVNPQVGGTVMRALAGLGLGLVGGPLAALVPMVDLGGTSESGCGGALRPPSTSEAP